MFIRKKKKDYYSIFDIKKVTDNKIFWKTIKPLLSDKIVSTERINLIDNGEVVPVEQDTAYAFSTFFSHIVINLKIPEYTDCDPTESDISDSMSHYMDNVLSKHECCFRKGYSTQECLLKTLKK